MTSQVGAVVVSVTVKPIDDVDGQNGLESGGNGSRAGLPVFLVRYPLNGWKPSETKGIYRLVT